MYAKYKAEVLEEYQRKKNSNGLSVYLVNPTSANLKNECLQVLKEKRYLKKDEKTFDLFFGKGNDANEYARNVDRMDVDDFKTLANFIKGKTKDSKDKNIALLAWLIDFEPRPYLFNPNEVVEEKKKESAEIESNQNDEKITSAEDIGDFGDGIGKAKNILEKQPLTQLVDETIQSPKPWYKRKDVAFLLFLLMGCGAYLVSSFITPKNMYWAGDHYEPVYFNKNISGVKLEPLDKQKLDYFKRITRQDTLTEKDLKKVWFVPTATDSADCFTGPGNHPVTGKLLRPLEHYDLLRYVLRRTP